MITGGTCEVTLQRDPPQGIGAQHEMRTRKGLTDEHVTVEGRYRLQGSARAGATVRAGGTLQVHGFLAGEVVVEQDAMLSVEGTFAGEIVYNNGTVLLYGSVTTDWRHWPGQVAVAAGTVLMCFGLRRVERDGSLTEVAAPPEIKVDVDANRPFVAWDARAEAFYPLGPADRGHSGDRSALSDQVDDKRR
jgi:hypothetical protein